MLVKDFYGVLLFALFQPVLVVVLQALGKKGVLDLVFNLGKGDLTGGKPPFDPDQVVTVGGGDDLADYLGL